MLTAVVPTFNESKNINKFLKLILKISLVTEIIFIDDNSPDQTYGILKKSTKDIKKVRIILRKKGPPDLSKSLSLGIRKAKNELIVILDADLQHSPIYINRMFRILIKKKLDVVVASRFLNKKFLGNLGYLRSLISLGTIFIIHLFFKRKTSDPFSGFFLFRRELFSKHYKNFYLNGYKILFDIIYNGKNNIKINDLPIKFEKRLSGKSKFNLKIIKIFIFQFIYTFFR
jgi:dolichol-phosphate mannosyltransferase|tara:strand:+ start:598 stop:1284 length:687 start_codon:yes stop_codon:yes gene_type:complete